MPKLFFLVSFSASIVLATQISAQTTPNDPRATALATASYAALSAQPVADILATGSGQWAAGGTKASGAITLKMKGVTKARLDFMGGGFSRSEIRSDDSGPDGQWIGEDGVRHRMATHNCFGPAAWFGPLAIAQVMIGPNTILRYVGQEARAGALVDHVQFHTTNTEKDPHLARDLDRLATVDIFLDASSHLPLSVVFNIHPDNDDSRDTPTETRFADYRNVNGAFVPFRIQRILQGVLNLDVTVSSVTINNGLADSDFALQ
jgi:hypothetical protein